LSIHELNCNGHAKWCGMYCQRLAPFHSSKRQEETLGKDGSS
jgi:hypothetical protein